MAKKNPGDILTCDWNPVIGCRRYSEACAHCWFLDGIFPWQQRLGNIPAGVLSDAPHVFEKRLSVDALKSKKGIVGVCQHGDLFWDAVDDDTIHRILSVIEKTATRKANGTKYLLWTKRSGRMASFMSRRYPGGVPGFLACAVSIENEAARDERLADLVSIQGTRILVAEPFLGPFELGDAVSHLEWVIAGSETGGNARPLQLAWVRSLRDETKAAGKPFFIKQLGDDHRKQQRTLDGRTWDEFPAGFSK